MEHPVRALTLPALSAILLSATFVYLPLVVEDFLNHARLPLVQVHLDNAQMYKHVYAVADLHCDVLLWVGRDFSKTTKHPFVRDRVIGHVDVPRLQQGNVQIQVFAVSFQRSYNSHNESFAPFCDALLLTLQYPVSTAWFVKMYGQ